jgi:hypothetical protein
MDKMLSAQAILIKAAQNTQSALDEFHLSQFEGGITEFPVNSYVLLTPPQGPRAKLLPPKSGPFRVVNIVGSAYTIQDLVSLKNSTVHISALSPFLYDEHVTDPREVALQDQGEFEIENIVTHRGNKNKRSELEFLVKWKHYDESHNSWEPFHNLRLTSPLHKYLRENKMARHIIRTED